MNEQIDWAATEEYLKECEQAYAECGRAGAFVVLTQIMPVRDRFNKGERTQELHDEIREIKL